MAPKNEEVKELRNKIQALLTFEKETLIMRPEWGEITFEEARQDFDRIFDITGYMATLPIEILPLNALNTIKSKVGEIQSLFDNISKYTITQNNPVDQKNQFIANVRSQADTLYTQAAQWIPFLAYQKGDISKNIESLTNAVKEAVKLTNNAKEDISKKRQEIDEIIIKAREASAAAGAAVFTRDFLTESDNLRTSANSWLRVSALLALGTVVIALAMFLFAESGLDEKQLWQKLGTKFFVLATMLTATLWCGRIYKALMHQSSINKHRALSIQTLQAFSAAAADVSYKDAIVLEATKAVFGNVPTGYIDSAGSSGDGDIKILEVAKNILPRK